VFEDQIMSDDSFEADPNAKVTARRTTRSVRKQTKEDLQVLEDEQIPNETQGKTGNRARSRAGGNKGGGWISKK